MTILKYEIKGIGKKESINKEKSKAATKMKENRKLSKKQ